MNQREYRFITAELRAEQAGEDKYLTGYAAKFGVKSEDLGGFRETIKPGAFKRALSENQDVRALFNHDSSQVLGRSTAGTLELSEDSTGLKYRVKLPNTSYANDLHESVKRGDITQSSFGFRTQKQSWSEDTADSSATLRTLEDVDLFDVSPVTYPAYPDATVSAGRSLEMRAAFPDGIPADIEEHRSKQKTVDGEALTSGDFLLIGNPSDVSTWALPWKFDSEAKTKSHLRDALARFDQVEGFSEEEKQKAFVKLVHLALAHGIDVSDEEKKKAGVSTTTPEGHNSSNLTIEAAKFRTRLAEISITL